MPHIGKLRRWATGCLCAGLGLGCASAPQGQTWRQIHTAHFELHTDLRDPEALDMARALEEARAGLLTLAWRGAPELRGRTEVVVFASEDRFRDYVRQDDTQGLAQSWVGAERFITTFWDDERPSGLPRVAVHEIAHDLAHWFTPLQPPWYSEGMASFLEGLEFNRATQQAILGEVPGPMYRVLVTPGRTAGDAAGLFAASSAVHDDVWTTSRFYFTSWLLIHYLLNHHPEPFNEFQRDLYHLRDWREAWSSRFPGLGPAELDAGLELYLDGGRFEYTTAKVELPPFTPRVRELSPAEAYGLSSWIAHRLGADELSDRDRGIALALDPQELNALRVRYDDLTGERHGAERRSLARQLVHAHPQSGEAWLLLGRSGESEQERSAALDAAQRLMPDHPGVLELAAARALEAGDSATALRYTDVLIRRTTLAPKIVSLHLKALAGKGRCDAARRFAKSASANYPKDWVMVRRRERVPFSRYFEDLIRERCEGASTSPRGPAAALSGDQAVAGVARTRTVNRDDAQPVQELADAYIGDRMLPLHDDTLQ